MHATYHKTRWIPQNAQSIPHELGIVYYARHPRGYQAIAYKGKANRPSWNYSFHTLESIQKHAAEWFAGLEQAEKLRAERAAARSAPHSIPIGAIIVNTWGYDQTNVDFYQVMKASRNYVYLREIASKAITSTGSMSGTVAAIPGQFTSDEVTQHRVYSYEGAPSVNFKHGAGNVWDGKPERESWYA